MASNWGGSRKGAGRPADEAITAARIGLELFQAACRRHKLTILRRFMKIVEEGEAKEALEAGKVVLAYGFGKPRETVQVEGEVITRYEYGSFEEVKQVLTERGLPIDRLLQAKVLDLDVVSDDGDAGRGSNSL